MGKKVPHSKSEAKRLAALTADPINRMAAHLYANRLSPDEIIGWRPACLMVDLGPGYYAAVPWSFLPKPIRRPTAIRGGEWVYATFKPLLRWRNGSWLYRIDETKQGVL